MRPAAARWGGAALVPRGVTLSDRPVYRRGMKTRFGNLPQRLSVGGFLLYSGISKLNAEKEDAARYHAMASGTYPFFEQVPPERFAQGLALGEVALGGALVLPVVPDRLAGLGLAGFAGGLMGMYLKTPGLRQEGSVLPTEQGIPMAKDIWLLGIALSLLTHSQRSSRRARRARKQAEVELA